MPQALCGACMQHGPVDRPRAHPATWRALQYNLLVLYDAKYRRLYRPSSMSLSSASLDGEEFEVGAAIHELRACLATGVGSGQSTPKHKQATRSHLNPPVCFLCERLQGGEAKGKRGQSNKRQKMERQSSITK